MFVTLCYSYIVEVAGEHLERTSFSTECLLEIFQSSPSILGRDVIIHEMSILVEIFYEILNYETYF